jgi:archaellum biogenesis protein FlaJ (TadC family)
MQQLNFVFAVAIFLLALVTAAVYFLLRQRRTSRTTWMALMARLRQIDRDKFATVALDLLEYRDAESQLDPDSIFEMVGGMDGLDALEQNCDVLIDMAAYVQRWYPEAMEIAEELRLNSREIQWHIGRLRGAVKTGHMYEQFPLYAQRAVATYYLMTRSLLVLYEGGQVPGFAELQRAL